jgi:hypothetical protein
MVRFGVFIPEKKRLLFTDGQNHEHNGVLHPLVEMVKKESAMKTCVTCKHECELMCFHPSVKVVIDPVVGGEVGRLHCYDCRDIGAPGDLCGRDGKYWEKDVITLSLNWIILTVCIAGFIVALFFVGVLIQGGAK